MPFALLLAMQAAGMVVDYMGTENQSKIAAMGAKVERAGMEANLYQTRLESEDQSLQALKTLRSNMGTQLAIFSARGTNPGAGSALGLLTESVGNFNSDERMRRMNLLGREASIKAGKSISMLNQSAEKSKLWQGFASRTTNKIPTSPSAYSQMGKSFGITQIGGS